jgi:tetratricopeptide (TPR) repeat protein
MMTILMLLGGTVAFAADPQTPFDQANIAFAQKDYPRAASDYEAIIAHQGFSAPVLFDLANTYYQSGKIGLAIVNYERAQLLAPRDADIAFNLHMARIKAGVADRPIPVVERAVRFLSLNTLSWIGATAILLIGVGIVTRRFTGRNRLGWQSGMVASTCILAAVLLAVGMRWSELSQAIITVKNTPMYISPVSIGQPLYTLAEGQTVALRKAYGEFLLVETTDGHRGWVKHADITPLIATKNEAQSAAS